MTSYLEPQLRELFPWTVQIALPDGTFTTTGQPNYGPPKSYRAFIDGRLMDVRTKTDAQNVQLFSVIVDAGDDPITADAKLTLPNDSVFAGQTPLIYTVERLHDGQHFYAVEISCGFMYHRQGQK